MEPRLSEELAGYAPTHAVRGNLDPPESGLPETLELELAGVRVALIHDSGRKDGRHRRMARRFPEARVVVFGHSHIPLLEDGSGLMLLNPGSPTDKRRQPDYTFAELEISDGQVGASIHTL
jgi:putative phosphoesterase